jgi:hypothetical protein
MAYSFNLAALIVITFGRPTFLCLRLSVNQAFTTVMTTTGGLDLTALTI